MYKDINDNGISANRLINIIQQMSLQQTNPVLEVLGNEIDHLKQEQKYPQSSLDFQQGPWRAFYHCHAVPDSDLQEHGHFHIFTQAQGQWVHVVALSMDIEGQPQAWLTVNRWVTDGPWLPAAELAQHLTSVNYSMENLSLLENWLLTMLQVYAIEVNILLAARDEILHRINMADIDAVVLNNRDIYTLATQKIDLLAKLTSPHTETQAGEKS